MIRRWGTGQWLLRGVVAAGPLAALLATGLAGVTPSWWLVLLVAGLGVGFAVLPDSPVGTVAIGAVVLWWGVALGDGLHPAALLAAGCLVAAHVAATVAALGSDDMVLDPATVRLWAARGAAVLLVAPVLWLLVESVEGVEEVAGVWLAGMFAALVATAAAGVAYTATRGE